MYKRSRPELIDCGRVSTRTQGLSYQILYEQYTPPFNRQRLIWPS